MKQQKRMLRVLAENRGFNPKVLKTLGKRLKVGIIDADLLDHEHAIRILRSKK